MDDLAAIRAEIKTWERTFKAQQGRDPSVDDIKKLPDIAQRYKIYKKLSKAAAVKAPPTFSSQSPSTPPRQSRPRNDLLSLVNSRVVATAVPLSTFNPFSPQKAKGKEREKLSTRVPQPVFNPFSSPAKSRIASPPAPTLAISRARKRLRGEPVSPSPSKEKRRRTGSQTTLNLPRLTLGKPPTSSKEHNHSESDDDEHEFSFVDDSPVKSSGRAFNLLFDEGQPLPSADIFGLKNPSSSKRPSPHLFGPRGSARKLDETKHVAHHFQKKSPPVSLQPNINNEVRFSGIMPEDNEDTNVISDQDPPRRSRSPLLPPSPPPASSMPKGPGKGKRKANSKAYANRKKMKRSSKERTDGEESSSDHFDLKTRVKIVDRPRIRKAGAGDDIDSEFDLVFDLPRGPRDSIPTMDTPVVEVNLPDRFKEILDLETTQWQAQNMEEDKLVESLLYGRRTTCYDSKKGEIWDVGEDVVANDDEQREDVDDEWEGEPVPWELAEL